MRSCICVLGVSILPLSTIFLMGVGKVPTVSYFFGEGGGHFITDITISSLGILSSSFEFMAPKDL